MVNKYKNEEFVRLEYKDISPKEHFEVSNYGRIKSFRTSRPNGKIINGSFISGYNTVQIRLKNGKMKSFFVHKLVAEFFCEKANEDQTYVVHKDFDKTNNYYLNLMWVNRAEMSEHNRKAPDYNKKKIRNSKLTEESVKAILRRLKKIQNPSRLDYIALAQKHNVTTTQIRRIAKGENWAHIKI